MGGADVIPGVSGGTMALIVGVYERLVGALSSAVSLGLALLRLDLEAARLHWAAVPWGLVLPLGAGILAAIKVGALVIPDLMATYPEQMRGLFLGLVGASLLIPALRIRRLTALRAGVGLACAVAAFLLTGLPVLEVEDPGLLRVFLSASVAICAMILPGVSGAFLLEVLGIYTPTLAALNGLDLPYVLTFVLGAAVGLGAFAKLLDWLLTARHDATMAALVGLIAGALRALWPYTGAGRSLQLPGPSDPVISVLALAVIGFAAVVGLLWWERRRPAKTARSAP
jgi:putative membrane protein